MPERPGPDAYDAPLAHPPARSHHRAHTATVLSFPTVSAPPPMLDERGYVRSIATLPGAGAGRVPANKGRRYDPTPPTSGEMVAALRGCPDTPQGHRLRALLGLLWRTGLRISEALALEESDLNATDGSVLVRHGKGDKRRTAGMDPWGWEQLRPWLLERELYPPGPLFCVLEGPTAGRRAMGSSQVRHEMKRLAADVGLRKRFVPHQLRHAHACELIREGVRIEADREQHSSSSSLDRSGLAEPQHLPGLEPVVRDPAEIALPALEEHKPVATYAMLSGGHDSAAVARWAAEHLRVDALLHINTTIGVEETREYVRDLARLYDLPLVEETRDDHGNGYEELVRKFGFPGPGFHLLPYALLKERALARVMRRAKAGHPRTSKVALISGVRRQESERRMGTADPVGHRGSQLWINPFFDYSTPQLAVYRREAGVPVNDVAALLGKSGECYCGAFAKPGELEDTTALGFPAVERECRRLEGVLRREAHPACKWGERPPPRIAEQQRKAGQLELGADHPMPMCIDCGPVPDDERQAA